MKHGGRKKGTPNKRTLELAERAKRLDVDPFEILLLFAKGAWKKLGYKTETRTCFTQAGIEFEEDIIKPEHRIKAAAEAAQYLFPKRKAVEITGKEGGPVEVADSRPALQALLADPTTHDAMQTLADAINPPKP